LAGLDRDDQRGEQRLPARDVNRDSGINSANGGSDQRLCENPLGIWLGEKATLHFGYEVFLFPV
jgi:hypothetical protein